MNPDIGRSTLEVEPSNLAERWRRARLAALGGSGSETERITALGSEAAGAALVEVARNCFRLGRSAAAHAGPIDDADRLAAVLAASQIPCVAESPDSSTDGVRFRRAACADFAQIGALACDFYRESLDGLVCGLSEKLRYSRVASRGRGGDSCEDRLYAADRIDARFAPVPGDVEAHLAGPLERLAARGNVISLLGLEENRLVVSCAGGRATGCGPDGLYIDLLASHLASRFPQLLLVDATPRAVMA